MKYKFLLTYIFLALFLMVTLALSAADDSSVVTRLKFNQLSTIDGLPTDEVQKVFQDRDGFIWFGTRYGLCLYDGYRVSLYKSNLYFPHLLTNNNILCMADDANHNLWIGTQDGLNVLNRLSGSIRKIKFPNVDANVISSLLVTKDNTVWVGTDIGLGHYDASKDSVLFDNEQETGNVLTSTPIKSMIEDSQGDIWIGTCSKGLHRYSSREKRFYAYPQMNERHSAHVVYEDSKQTIWVGTWEGGLFRLEHPRDMKRVAWVNYRHTPNDASSLSDNIVYDITEDTNTHALWVGTRSGLSIMNEETPGRFVNYKSRQSPYIIGCNEINSLLCDQSGTMWIGSIGGGVFMTDTRKSKFTLHRFNVGEADIPTSSVRTIFVDSQDNTWLGIGTYGVARHDRKSDKLIYYTHIPEFSEIKSMATVYAIIQRKSTGAIWLGAYDDGIYEYVPGQKVKHWMHNNCGFLKDDCVTALYEDRKGNCWIGTRYGLGVCRADGSSHLFDRIVADGRNLDRCNIRCITEDGEGNIWLATSNYGIICMSGDVHHPEQMSYTNYSPDNQKLSVRTALCLFLDSYGRFWAGLEGGGLCLYDKTKSCFVEKTPFFNLPGDMVSCIEEDNHKNLWLSTNSGLVRLNIEEEKEEDKATLRVYTSADGLQDNFFISGCSFNHHGELLFGGYKGYNSFHPEDLNENDTDVLFYITDIKIFNRSFGSLDADLRQRISERAPAFTSRIDLPYEYNNFSIEFAALTYRHPELNKYAYMLKGFDKEWQYTDATRRFAYYNNLKSGTYTFQLKATDENGVWSGFIRELIVVVHPPFWATWWAYLLYVLLAGALISYLLYATRNRLLLENQLRLRELEKSQAEELNHAKLQFFTNITHELLTPLTIISATVDEMKIQAPKHDDLYGIMGSNIHRLIRLLQQILEFRKAETGNLRLRVSPGDIAAFVKNEAECFQPLIKKRKLHFSVLCDPESITGYFDTDKLDKILYNLLSNAAKYNKEGGYVQVTLARAQDRDFVLLTVKDNGNGISKENQKTLFRRFYEGDYRKFNTIGTGIGLSLTKDLVELHGGSIQVESEINRGTTFLVRLPVVRDFFREEEIDEEAVIPAQKAITYEGAEAARPAGDEREKNHSILVLEDNEELLQLMVKLLGRDYRVFTAENGKEGIVVVENEDIDLIVSDIMMPEMDGIEFCKYVKSKLEISHIPVLLLTAKNKEEDRAEAYEVGADAFLNKPFNLPVLHARIKNLLKHKERMAHDFKNQLVFEVKDLNYTSIDEGFMQRAIDCVYRHLEDCTFDQPQFIEEMGTSKSTLYKKLKSLTGLNTSSFIRNIRLKAACQMMEEKGSGMRISELAYAVGFNDPKYFSSCFKREFGMLPSEYMERFLIDKETI